ncbi:MAG TPA: DnaJ C-terminal domain-containing protein, partial [Solirubrobacteraceae bacterium]
MRTMLCGACHGDGRLPTQPCGECRGHGRRPTRRSEQVSVPAGIADGQRIRVGGAGHAGERGAPSGDLYVLVRVRPDERFVREGDDLITALDLSAPLASLGATLEVPTLEGSRAVEVPAGVQPGEVLSVRGEGMPSLRGGRRGDLRVLVNIVVPRRLSDEQRDLIARLNDTLTEENLRSEESVFGKLRRALRHHAA